MRLCKCLTIHALSIFLTLPYNSDIMHARKPILNPKKRYLQIALNSTLSDARSIIQTLPRSDRIILEAGTPFIKRYGIRGIREINTWYSMHLAGISFDVQQQRNNSKMSLTDIIRAVQTEYARTKNAPAYTQTQKTTQITPYIVADLKMMDRGMTEVELAHEAGASAVTALGHAPIESLNTFIERCRELNIDSMIDMMNVDFPVGILRELKSPPDVVILHRGVDESEHNKEKMLPLHEIRRTKSAFDTLVAVAGGDTVRDVQRAMFNDADIAVVWKDFYQKVSDTGSLAHDFLKEIK
jgi:bifunctional enzyme Fae/Hps